MLGSSQIKLINGLEYFQGLFQWTLHNTEKEKPWNILLNCFEKVKIRLGILIFICIIIIDCYIPENIVLI